MIATSLGFGSCFGYSVINILKDVEIYKLGVFLSSNNQEMHNIIGLEIVDLVL
jgi:hypothetical protein